jgi:hypothetical protein
LGDRFGGGKLIQARHQGVLECGRNRQGRQRTGPCVVLFVFPEPVGRQHQLGQLFDKERHAIALGDDLLDHLCRQCLRPGHCGDHLPHLRVGEAGEGELGNMRPQWPGRGEVRAEGAQRQYPRCWSLLHQQAEEF